MDRVKEQIGWSGQRIAMLPKGDVSVAVLDTGIAKHPDLADNIREFVDLRNHREEPYDDNGHGTHVAGCIAGTGRLSGGKYCGIAPGVGLVGIKILDQYGDGDFEHLIQGLDWVLQNRNRYHIRVVNISVGIQCHQNPGGLHRALSYMDSLWESGVIVVCAAGNMGPAIGSLSGLAGGVKVIAVGCHEGGYFGKRKGLCEQFSGRGYGENHKVKPDLVAPGTNVVSCNAKYLLQGKRSGKAYISKTGTSMSAPIVSGALALLILKYPELSNRELRERLLVGTSFVSPSVFEQGHGMINIRKLLKD